ncbi:MAG TPA: T9SS sorting signal type C domain-containing protein, partial [Flavobacterium sp.]|nr:T9SS sorting signal type C domain-containing protein [Flavobacterium sp.]
SNPNLLNVKSVSLFDITGKLIFNKEKLAAEPSYEFSTSGLSDSVYIVKINTAENKEISKKVLIFKE